jgi:peptide deformylase
MPIGALLAGGFNEAWGAINASRSKTERKRKGHKVLLKICEVGNPVLRKVAQPLTSEEIQGDAMQNLVGHMRETMRDGPGVGLAAPQIGESLRIVVIEDRASYQQGLSKAHLSETQRVPVDFHVIINPVIELLSPSDISFYEGCLSIPRLMAKVPRSGSVRVTCLDEHAEPRVIMAEGWYARILQHEIDHLEGRLYTDLMQSETLTTIESYQRNIMKSTLPSQEGSSDKSVPLRRSQPTGASPKNNRRQGHKL